MPWPGRLLLALFLGVFLLAQWSPEVPLADRVDDKVEHAVLYYVLALVLWPLVPATDALARAGVVVSIGFLLALVMEAGQSHLPHRTPDTRDVLADLAGLVAASAPLAWAGLNPVRGGGGAR